jgi:hypothetical protein
MMGYLSYDVVTVCDDIEYTKNQYLRSCGGVLWTSGRWVPERQFEFAPQQGDIKLPQF